MIGPEGGDVVAVHQDASTFVAALEPGAVDVIDTPTLTRVKSIPIEGAVHNTYVTPDGRYVILVRGLTPFRP